MKKSVLFLTLLLLATIAGTFAVYELYVKQRMKELGEHITQQKNLEARIVQLRDAFAGRVPDVYIEAWRKSTQPWSDAVQGRSQFFTLGDFDQEVEIPEEVIPKIYYKEELPKRIKSLEDYAAENQVQVGDVNCGVPGAGNFGEGTNPKREEIAEHLKNYDYCAAVTKMIVDAKPISLDPLRIWPEITKDARSGAVKKRTTGISMRMSTQAMVRFLDKLSQSDRYFRVEEFKISNSDLNQNDPILSVELVLTQAKFEQTKKAAGTAVGGGADSAEVNQLLSSVFGGGANAQAGDTRERANQPQLSAWQQFRRTWLPF